jgi:hypothetical protein
VDFAKSGAAVKVGRHELKYFITPGEYHSLKAWLDLYTRPDKWIAKGRKHYTIHSIYFDTHDLDFYFEKMDGVKVRKKLRIRGYDGNDDMRDIFLEIKRKYGNVVVKERAPLKLRHVEPILDSGRPQEVLPQATFRDLRVIGKFLHTIKARALRPSVLVVYEREALVGREDNRTRITFDGDVRCAFGPRLRHIFTDGITTMPFARTIIMELKFDGPMPPWMRRLVWQFGLAARPISKYCASIEACCRRDWNQAFSLLRAHSGDHDDF